MQIYAIRRIPGWPTYAVSKTGGVYSLKRSGWKQLKHKVNSDGYWDISLNKNGKMHWFGVHRLLWLAWNGPIPPKMEVNHIDGVKSNNTLLNLELVTHKQNLQHASKAGLLKPATGQRHPRPGAALTEEQVGVIKAILQLGCLTQREIGELFGVVQGAISDIARGTAWSHVEVHNADELDNYLVANF